jgi:hypothetical protein
MIEVFPTPWSPRKTNLYFAKGEILGALEAIWFWSLISGIGGLLGQREVRGI